MPDENGRLAAGTSASPGSDPDVTSDAYRALRQGAVVVDRSDRLRMRFTGAGAAETLNGLVTNEVTALAPGEGQYALALTPKGKIISDVRLFVMSDGVLADVASAAAPGWTGMIRKYVNPRLAKYADVTGELGDLGVFGAAAHDMLLEGLGSGDALPADLSHYAHVRATVDGSGVIVARSPDFGVEGYDVFAEPAALDRLHQRLLAAGAIGDPGDALIAARIEAGRPEWGVDMDESTLAQEADMDRLQAISYTKGCYTGQETVARVHFRGHVNRLLRGLRLSGEALPLPGTAIVTGEGKETGTVGSAVRSPALGGVALGLVRREVEPGTTVRAGEAVALVIELPFESPRSARSH